MSLARVMFTTVRTTQWCPSCRLLQTQGNRINHRVTIKRNLLGSIPKRTIFSRPQHSKPTVALSEDEPRVWKASALPMRYIYVKTSEWRWEDIPDGFIYDTGYVDSHADSPYDPKIPVILAVHGLMSSHKDLIPLLAPLVLKNYRVIGINLPSSVHTNGVAYGIDDAYLHSVDENAEFIADFLGELNIPKVDVMLGYGTGCYPIVRICDRSDLCTSAALISPAGHMLCRGIQPFMVYEYLVQKWETPFLRPFVKLLIFILKPFKGYWKNTIDDGVNSIHVINGIDFTNIGSYLFGIKSKGMPVGVVYSKDDQFTETDILKHYCELLGFMDEHFSCYDADGQLIKKADVDPEIVHHGIIFEKGDPIHDYKNQILNLVDKLVKLGRKQ